MHRKIEETPEREKMLIRLKELRLERGYSMTQAKSGSRKSLVVHIT